MADKQSDEIDRSYGNASLDVEIASRITRRLSMVCRRVGQKRIVNLLCKRKKKWTKREGRDPELESDTILSQLDKEKAALSDIAEELCDTLVACRKEGISQARQMERDKTLHSLNVLIDRSKRLQNEFNRYKRMSTETIVAPVRHHPTHVDVQEKLLQDLQRAISQAQELKKINKMKFQMTPRLPAAIHARNLVENSKGCNGFNMANNEHLFDQEHAPSDITVASAPQLVPLLHSTPDKLNDYLLEVQLPTIAQTIEATSEELNFAAELQKAAVPEQGQCANTAQHSLDEEEPKLLKLLNAVKTLPKDTRS